MGTIHRQRLSPFPRRIPRVNSEIGVSDQDRVPTHPRRTPLVFLGSWMMVFGSIVQCTSRNTGQYIASRLMLGFGIPTCIISGSALIGELGLRGSSVQQFNEKPVTTQARVSGGFFVFRRDFFDHLRDDPRLVLETGPLPELARAGELMAYQHDGFWQPMDTSREYQHLNELWNRGQPPWASWDEHTAHRRAA